MVSSPLVAPTRPSTAERRLVGLVGLGVLVVACTQEPLTIASASGDSTAEADVGTSLDGTTTGEITSGSGMTGESGPGADSSGSSGEPEPTDCTAPQPIPPGPPVDCSGADEVIDISVLIEDGGDDPSSLVGVVRVEGSVRINRVDVENLDFMACLQEVTGDVTIFGNEQLTNVDGLFSLSSIGTDFIFSENTAITDFDGVPNLTTVPGSLVLRNNDSLLGISGFHSLVEVDNLIVQNNEALLDIDGLGGLTFVGDALVITANPQLCQSSIICVGSGILVPPMPFEGWSTEGNNPRC